MNECNVIQIRTNIKKFDGWVDGWEGVIAVLRIAYSKTFNAYYTHTHTHFASFKVFASILGDFQFLHHFVVSFFATKVSTERKPKTRKKCLVFK